MPEPHDDASQALVLVGEHRGITVIPQPSPLTRLHYFDGKFLRAADLQQEQRYLRRLTETANRAGGAGVVAGFDTVLASGDRLTVGSGLAIDSTGHPLLLNTEVTVGIQELIDKSRAVEPDGPSPSNGKATFGDCEVQTVAESPGVSATAALYVVSIAHAEAFCGEEEVFGRLCEDACATATDRPFVVDGLVLLALPLDLVTTLATSRAVLLDRSHLRSRVASAYFSDEAGRTPRLLSRAGLTGATWCLGVELEPGDGVPLAVIARAGGGTEFLDAWTVRRERIEPPSQRYWAWRTAMRPWDVFLAQVLQFQCQVAELLAGDGAAGGGQAGRQALDQAARVLDDLQGYYTGQPRQAVAPPDGIERIEAARAEVHRALQRAVAVEAGARALVDGGIVELPPAGYLPVDPASTTLVNAQVHRLLGPGVDLRFCVARADVAPHAFQEAQHLDRISLLQGLDDPGRRPQVDILVPDGEIISFEALRPGVGFEATVRALEDPGDDDNGEAKVAAVLEGVARGEVLQGGGLTLAFAGAGEAPRGLNVSSMVRGLAGVGGTDPEPMELLRGLLRVREAQHARAHADQRVAERLRDLAGRASGFVSGLSGAPARVFRPTLPRGASRMMAAWVELRLDRSPLDMDVNDLCSVVVRAAGAAPARAPIFADAQLWADLRITQAQTVAATVRRMRARLTGVARVSVSTDGTPPTPQAIQVDQELELEVSTPAGQHPTVTVTLPLIRGQLVRLELRWGGRPLQVTASLTKRVREEDLQIGDATLLENPDVLQVGNERHTVALFTIDLIDAALGGGFGEAATRLLFPPTAPPPDEQIVRATRGWVLFHRRRDVDCGVLAPPDTVAPPRQYQIWARTVTDRGQAAELAGILADTRNPEGAGQLGLKRVEKVAFAAGLPDLTTPAAAVQEAWKDIVAGDNTVLHVAVATHASVEDEVLANPRAHRLLRALGAPPTSIAEDVRLQVLERAPSPLVVPGTAGLMVVLSQPDEEAETACHTVYRVDPTNREAIAALKAGDLDAVFTTQPRPVILVGSAEFLPDSDELHSETDELVSGWQTAGGGTVAEVIAIASTAEASAEDKQRARARASAVAAALGAATTVEPETNETDDAIPDDDCPVLAFIVPEAV